MAASPEFPRARLAPAATVAAIVALLGVALVPPPAGAQVGSTERTQPTPIAISATPVTASAAARRAGAAPVELDAASSEVDYKSNTLLFRDVTVSQGSTRVSADRARATGLDFAKSTWIFAGNVRIALDGGSLRSGEATVVFANNRIARATILGSPAEFEQRLANTPQLARGRAESIVYDVPGGTVTLSRNAWLTDGRNEIAGEQLVYSVQAQRVQAGGSSQPGARDRVRITIRPPEPARGAP